MCVYAYMCMYSVVPEIISHTDRRRPGRHAHPIPVSSNKMVTASYASPVDPTSVNDMLAYERKLRNITALRIP